MRPGTSTDQRQNSTETRTATKSGVDRTGFAPGRWVRRVLAAVIIIFFVLFFATPLAWLVLAPTKSTAQLNGLHGEQPFSFGSFAQLAENWNRLLAFQHGIFLTWLGNSVLYVGVALVLTLVVTIPAGYALAMINFRFRRVLLVATLIVMLIPFTALVLPIFLELSVVHLIGTPLALILPFSFFPFGVYLAYIYFSTTVSRDLLDAARIDGAGEVRVFRSVALPLAAPVVALVGFFNVVTNWNNYFLPFVTQPGWATMPAQVGLTELFSNRVSSPQLALATLVSVGPVLIIFLFSQRFLVSGLTAGAVNE